MIEQTLTVNKVYWEGHNSTERKRCLDDIPWRKLHDFFLNFYNISFRIYWNITLSLKSYSVHVHVLQVYILFTGTCSVYTCESYTRVSAHCETPDAPKKAKSAQIIVGLYWKKEGIKRKYSIQKCLQTYRRTFCFLHTKNSTEISTCRWSKAIWTPHI